MRIAAPLALVELVRSPGRTLLRVLTLAAAVGLLAAMLLFVGHSLGTMTGGAVRSVPVDWQGPIGSYRAATAVASRVARQPGVAEAAASATAPFAAVQHVSAAAGTIRPAAGRYRDPAARNLRRASRTRAVLDQLGDRRLGGPRLPGRHAVAGAGAGEPCCTERQSRAGAATGDAAPQPRRALASRPDRLR